jgi:nucleoid DNA-binding protein
MTKAQFIDRLRKKTNFEKDTVRYMVDVIFAEIIDIIDEGDELQLDYLGRFYPKLMNPRIVRGGFDRTTPKEYAVGPRVKVGFSSFPSLDKVLSENALQRESDQKANPRPASRSMFDDLDD